MMTDTPADEGLVNLSPPPPGRLDSPIPDHIPLDELQRQLDEKFGYHVDIRRYIELVTDNAIWDMPDMVRELKVTRAAVDKWRSRTKEDPDGPVGLPEPLDYKGQSPVWYAGTIRYWAIEKGKMLPDGTPIKAKGTGRPLRPRKPRD